MNKQNKLSFKQLKKTKIKLSETPDDKELCDLIENLEEKTYESQKIKPIIPNNNQMTKQNVKKTKNKEAAPLDSELLYNQMKFLSCCPICQISFDIYSDKIIDHFKSCKKLNNISLENFNELAKAQDALDILRLKHGLETVNNLKDQKAQLIQSKKTQVTIFKNKSTCKKGSTILKNYPLINRTSEERNNIILDKVALILMETNQEGEKKLYPDLKIKSKFLISHLRERNKSIMLWYLSENNNSLEDFYVPSLNLINDNHLDPNYRTTPEYKFKVSRDIINLQKENQSKLCQDWKKLLLSDTYSDISIIVENNKIIPAHQCVLEARCPEMLKFKLSEKIILLNCTLKSIQFVLYFIYCAHIDINITLLEKDIKALKFLVSKFKIPELQIYLENITLSDSKSSLKTFETEIFDSDDKISYKGDDSIISNKNIEINFSKPSLKSVENEISDSSGNILKNDDSINNKDIEINFSKCSKSSLKSVENEISDSNDNISSKGDDFINNKDIEINFSKCSKSRINSVENGIFVSSDNISKSNDSINNKDIEINFEKCLQSTPKSDKPKKLSNIYKNTLLSNLINKRKSSEDFQSPNKKYKKEQDLELIDIEEESKDLEKISVSKDYTKLDFSSSKFQIDNMTSKENDKPNVNIKKNLNLTEFSNIIDLTNENPIDNDIINYSPEPIEENLNINKDLLNTNNDTLETHFLHKDDVNYFSHNDIFNDVNNLSKSFNSPLNEENNLQTILMENNDKISSNLNHNHSTDSLIFSEDEKEIRTNKEKLKVNELDTPDLKKSLDKFGIKYLKKHQAISILSHIYEIINSSVSMPETNYNEEESKISTHSKESPDKLNIIEDYIEPASVNTKNTNNDRILDVTAMPDYSNLESPLLKKEMNKYGLKNLKRKDAKKILQHIYEMLHPINIESIENEKNKERNICRTDDLQYEYEFENLPEEMNFESQKEHIKYTNDVHLNFHDLLNRDKNLHKEILLYSPILLKRFNKEFKNCNNKKLMDFLDEKAITFRMNPQVIRSKRK